MTALGDAYALAVALYGRDTSQPLCEIADTLYDLVDVLDFGSDERKADLYAQLAEGLTEDTSFADAVCIIETAMRRTIWRYPHA